MNFWVEWETPLRAELHQLWTTAPDPAAVRGAAEKVEQLLAADPYSNGRHLSEGLWRLHVPPLVVHYTIDPDRQYVEITDVIHTA